MAIDYIVPLGEETGQKMLEALKGQASELGKLVMLKEAEVGHGITTIADWGEVSALVSEDLAKDVFPLGTVLHEKWVDPRSTVSTEWDYGLRVVAHEQVNVRGREDVPGLTLHSKLALPFGTAFDASEAFYAAPEGGLAAGTYTVAFGNTSAWGAVPANAQVSFTLTKDLPAGGQLCFSSSVYSTAPAACNVVSYATAGATEALETVACSDEAAAGAVSLGTIPATAAAYDPDGTLNHLHRIGLGSNRWKTSALRQWLNSAAAAGSWWTPQTKWDRPPAYASTTAGFLSAFSEDFVDHLAYREIKTALPYIDGGTSKGTECDTTHDRVWLPAAEQLYWNCEWLGVPYGLEGDAWEWWKEAYGGATPASMGVVHEEFRMASMDAPTTMRSVFERSAYRNNGNGVACCNAGGYLGSGTASNGYSCAPAYTFI
ncbi:MAG: hypothetical protein IKN60_04450 [Bacteroidales bacterium]|nr:hypothetical protein [Bacteroidales bacterium]